MMVRILSDVKLLVSHSERTVRVVHYAGDSVEVADTIGHLLVAEGVAVAVKRPQRAVKPRGEVRGA